MSAVIGIGQRSGPFVDRPVHAVTLDPAALGDLGTLHDVLTAQLDREGTVVVLHHVAVEGTARRALRTVSRSLGGAPVLCHATALPPLAADVLVTLAASLVAPLGAAEAVAAALPLLEGAIAHITWLPTVKGLADPAPSLAQHAASALPGRSWLVRSWPAPTIDRADPRTPPPPPPPVPAGTTGVALADEGGDTSWVDAVTRDLHGAVGVRVPAPPGSAAHWGAAASTQLVVHPHQVDAVAAALRPLVALTRCRSCRRATAGASCTWCGVPTGAPGEAAAAAARVHQQVPA